MSGYMTDGKFHPENIYTQTPGDCIAQLAELKTLVMTLEHTDPEQKTVIVTPLNTDFCGVADLKEKLPNVHVVRTLGHQRVGIHVEGNTLADEAAKSAVAMASVAAVTHSKLRMDDETLAVVAASADGTPFPKAYPAKYFYWMAGLFDAQVTIPGVGVRTLPNKELRHALVKAVHEGVASAHACVAATISILQSRYW
ncbi:hypothetical protein NDU88_007381 [Pleurodeles waltl]|uniref:Uncharacterized protein n=1 Tax=Pleurodeles waltl TaxID=8319 RepID=A0AAV7PPR5_PLEWA|nr:hypothetical protein NDU88_007381 [Pleurodeles waltl]